MNKKVLFTLIILFISIVSASSVSAWWIFGGGSDVTVNGVNFHLPDGFDVENPVKSDIDDTYENTVYKNTETGDAVDIAVDNKVADDSSITNSLINKGFEQKNIAGKDGFYKMYLSTNVEFVYIDNDKVVSIIVPFVYDKYGDNFMKYDELLAEIIK
ncbi:hypothetical protein [Methanobrevibacter sp.]|uniref:hypothetical protein n=1 Tax=Methanobrevibacter sp. TaxID=66852 RepID=UPI00386F94A0